MRDLIARLDTALLLMAAETMDIRAIYLDAADILEFLRLQAPFTSPERPLIGSYRGHAVRAIKGAGPSKVYSTHGVARAVRRRA